MQLFNKELIPLYAPEQTDNLDLLLDTLASAGLHYIEIVLRTQYAMHAIEKASKHASIKVLAGTVTTPEQIEQIAQCGAQGIVSPGLDATLVDSAYKHNLPIFPGVQTASEIMQAMRMGITTCKAFPANILGGVDWLKAMAGPFPDMQFFPTGGIDAVNYQSFLECSNVAAVGGSFFLPKQWSSADELEQHLSTFTI